MGGIVYIKGAGCMFTTFFAKNVGPSMSQFGSVVQKKNLFILGSFLYGACILGSGLKSVFILGSLCFSWSGLD